MFSPKPTIYRLFLPFIERKRKRTAIKPTIPVLKLLYTPLTFSFLTLIDNCKRRGDQVFITGFDKYHV